MMQSVCILIISTFHCCYRRVKQLQRFDSSCMFSYYIIYSYILNSRRFKCQPYDVMHINNLLSFTQASWYTKTRWSNGDYTAAFFIANFRWNAWRRHWTLSDNIEAHDDIKGRQSPLIGYDLAFLQLLKAYVQSLYFAYFIQDI